MTAAPEIVEAIILRDPQPNDVVAFRVAAHMTHKEASDLCDVLRHSLPCRVLVLSEGITMLTEPQEAE